MVNGYLYVWVEPGVNGRSSYPYKTHTEAIQNALYNAFGCRTIPPQEHAKLWCSLEERGWEIKEVKDTLQKANA